MHFFEKNPYHIEKINDGFSVEWVRYSHAVADFELVYYNDGSINFYDMLFEGQKPLPTRKLKELYDKRFKTVCEVYVVDEENYTILYIPRDPPGWEGAEDFFLTFDDFLKEYPDYCTK